MMVKLKDQTAQISVCQISISNIPNPEIPKALKTKEGQKQLETAKNRVNPNLKIITSKNKTQKTLAKITDTQSKRYQRLMHSNLLTKKN